jgi:hypothetical protein
LSWLTVEGGLGIALNIKDYMVFVKDWQKHGQIHVQKIV